MEINSTYERERLIVRLSGDIDHHLAGMVRNDIDRLILDNNPKEFWLDLSEIEFMDSSGLGLVLGRYKKVTELGGLMKIINPTRRVLQILQLAGVEKIIKIERVSLERKEKV